MTAFEKERARLLAQQEELRRALRQEQQQTAQQQEAQGGGTEGEEWGASGSFGVDPLLVEATAEEARRCV